MTWPAEFKISACNCFINVIYRKYIHPRSPTAQVMQDNKIRSTASTLPFSPEAVYAAFACGPVLAAWWGPEGFTNTFHTFDFTVNGRWLFTMHGPDGKSYENTRFFAALEPARRIVIRHDCQPFFMLTVGLSAVEEGGHGACCQRADGPGERARSGGASCNFTRLGLASCRNSPFI